MAKVEIVNCEKCGDPIVLVKTSKGKVLTCDAVVTRIVMIDEKGEELKVKRMLTGNRLHDETCRKEGAAQGDKPKQGKTGQNPEGNPEQDVCPECGMATYYRTWTPPGETKVLEFWECPTTAECGRWWTEQGSGRPPAWKAATAAKQAAYEERRQAEQGKPGADCPI